MANADPAITILAALIAGWSLASPLDKYVITTNEDGVRFTTGVLMDEEPLFQVSCMEVVTNPRPLQLGMRDIRNFATMQFDIYAVVEQSTAKGPGKAKSNLWKLRKEVIRILKANKTGLTDIKHLYPAPGVPGRRLDDLARDPPHLRWSQDWVCTYDL